MISMYKECPARMHMLFYQRLPFHPTEPMVMGTIMHAIFNRFYDDIDMAYLLYLKAREEVQIYFRNILPDNDDRLNGWLDTFSIIESLRWEVVKDYNYPDRYFIPYRQELYLELDSLGLFGTLDRIDRTSNGFFLLDYKSKRGGYMSQLRRQLWIYQTLINYQKPQLVPGKIKEVGAYFYKTGGLYTDILGSRTINTSIRNIREVRKNIEAGLFPRRINEWCFRCSYLYLCLEDVNFDDDF